MFSFKGDKRLGDHTYKWGGEPDLLRSWWESKWAGGWEKERWPVCGWVALRRPEFKVFTELLLGLCEMLRLFLGPG